MSTTSIEELHGEVTEELKDIKLDDIVLGENQLLISITDHTGDRRFMWDIRDKDDVAEMERIFDEAKRKGQVVYHVDRDGNQGEVMQKFTKKAGKMIIINQQAGG